MNFPTGKENPMTALDPRLSARLPQMAQAFLTPRRLMPPGPDMPAPLSLHWLHGEIAVHRRGEGRPVLLVHGWEADHRDMLPIADAVAASGRQAVLVDLPAHGGSSGERTSIPQSADALLAVGRAFGPFDAVVAHSVGCACAMVALHSGLKAGRAVFLASPARYESYARAFSSAAGLPGEAFDDFLAALLAQGVDVRAVDGPKLAERVNVPALLLHARDDRVVPIEDGRALAAAWPSAELVELEGLGHRRILADDGVLRRTRAFLGLD